MTRTHQKFYRGYIDGVDVSGFSRSIGELNWSFEQTPDTAWTDEVKNSMNGRGEISAGTYSAFLDNTAAGTHELLNASAGTRNVMIAIGAQAAPAQGDNVFAWQFEQSGYKAEDGGGFMVVSVPLGSASYSSTIGYCKPWGRLLHAKGAETAANTAAGIDDIGAASTTGGIFVYHLLSSDGTVTLTAQEASTNTDVNFANITGATSGSITAAVTPKSGMIALGLTASIKRYLRWQLAFGTATTATFVCAFIRNN